MSSINKNNYKLLTLYIIFYLFEIIFQNYIDVKIVAKRLGDDCSMPVETSTPLKGRIILLGMLIELTIKVIMRQLNCIITVQIQNQ